jgi:hypothetical protein
MQSEIKIIKIHIQNSLLKFGDILAITIDGTKKTAIVKFK